MGDAREYCGAVSRCTTRRTSGHPSGRVHRGSRVAHQHHTRSVARAGATGRRGVHGQPHRGAALARCDAPTRSALAGIADGELLGYLDARAATISSLVAEAAEVVEAHGRRLVFLDFAGAIKGYATGRPTGGPAAEISWLHGIDIAEVARSCHGFEAIAYVADPERLRLDIETYLALIGGETPFGVCLRPSPPDCESAENLASKLSLVRSLGVARADFYHYGFLRLSALDWIRTALDAEPGPANPAADGAQPMAGLD